MSQRDIMECTECGWQGPVHQCDGGFCSMCGAEAVPWSEVYNEDGTPAAPAAPEEFDA